jgi:uncharacterized protein (UPF0261 family)
MKKTIVLLGTLDTKGLEFSYINEYLKQKGFDTVVVDAGIRGSPLLEPDISHDEVAAAAGATVAELAAPGGGEAMAINTMSKGAAKVAEDLYRSGKMDGIISVGGSLGTSVGTAAMRALPLGLPKVMVTTMASGDTHPYVGTKDIILFHSIADLVGLNRLTESVLANAAAAIEGMVANPAPKPADKQVIAITSLGPMTACAQSVKAVLEQKGYEVVIFHSVGTGGKALEAMIEEGLVNGVFDLTLWEITNRLFGGVWDPGPHRLETAGRKGIPQVVAPGMIDVIAFNIDAVAEGFRERKLIKHTESVIVAPLNTEEMGQVAEVVAEKLNLATGPTAVITPTKGFSPGGKEGRPYHNPERDRHFIKVLKERLKPEITFVELEVYINDAVFAEKAAALLIELMA